MKKLQRVLNDIQDEEKFIKCNRLSVSDYREFLGICSALSHGESDTTINAKVKAVCEKYGFGVFSEGIGWRIRLNRQPKKELESCLRSLYGNEFYEAHIKA